MLRPRGILLWIWQDIARWYLSIYHLDYHVMALLLLQSGSLRCDLNWLLKFRFMAKITRVQVGRSERPVGCPWGTLIVCGILEMLDLLLFSFCCTPLGPLGGISAVTRTQCLQVTRRRQRR
jgi:hypothetical protein